MKRLPILLMILIPIAVSLSALIFYLFVNIKLVQIVGNSMSPTIQDGKFCIAYNNFNQINRDDPVIISYEDKIIVSRVIGMPGDTIKNNNGTLTFNSMMHPVAAALLPECTIPLNTSLTLKNDEYFLLGDDEAHSLDSRYPAFGVIKKSRIVSKIWMCW